MAESAFLQIHAHDHVAVALRDVEPGEAFVLNERSIVAKEKIPKGHKMALCHLTVGDHVMKYGAPIGHLISDVTEGGHVHAHNLVTNLSGKLDYTYQPVALSEKNNADETLPQFFEGYVRTHGEVGIRNEIWIINTVGCINKVAERLAAAAHARFAGQGVDGVYHFAHPYGCSQLGGDLLYTQKALAGLVRHPNAAGVLVLGLGCENNRIQDFLPHVGQFDQQRILFLQVQSVQDEWEEGMAKIEQLVEQARQDRRQTVSVAKLKVGLKCGGSDGFSGITANPLIGAVSDLLVANGATSLLTEVPEMFGAETILMDRAKNEEVFHKIVHLINSFKDYYTRHNQVIYENPSPGNKEGGITTLEEKSLGCTQKGGHSTVQDVLAYGDVSVNTGLNLVEAPGNDMVSVTALIDAGAHIVLFSTGRGTPLGGAVPTLKIATNSTLASQKTHWIDFDAGRLLTGRTLHDLAVELYRQIIDVASGKTMTKNEQNAFREIAIFKDGVTL